MSVLYYIAGILVFIWLLGLILKIGGTLIYWALIAGVVLFIVGLFTGRRQV
ncbi:MULTISPECIES: DUF5670 family protein [unclassified Meiothermus]|uniref:DUF5670 family protein n=1 Tax=unclassified Meiothermus TaxID=370471 RepID=UPI0013ECD53D|nr:MULTISPECIES: DUF5670 family protein [unclassified Meiothermus]